MGVNITDMFHLFTFLSDIIMDATKIFSWIKSLPLWGRIVAILLIAGLAILFVSSCGTPKTVATVSNVNPNSTVTVTLSVSNENNTTVETEATPSVSFDGLSK